MLIMRDWSLLFLHNTKSSQVAVHCTWSVGTSSQVILHDAQAAPSDIREKYTGRNTSGRLAMFVQMMKMPFFKVFGVAVDPMCANNWISEATRSSLNACPVALCVPLAFCALLHHDERPAPNLSNIHTIREAVLPGLVSD